VTTIAGRRARRVTLYGRPMATFYEIGGRWLADTVWCAVRP
jgi:hypothetical protein